MKIGNYEVHPAARSFRPLTTDEHQALVASIRDRVAAGETPLIQPISLFDGKIVDGVHRAKACLELDIDPWVVFVTGDPYAIARDANCARRHMTAGEVALHYAAQATRDKGGVSGITSNTARAVLDSELPLTESDAAEEAGCSVDTIQRARRVLATGVPELVQAVKDDAVPIKTAAAIAQLEPEKQSEVLSKPHVSNHTGNVEWYTPQYLLGAVREVFGGEISLDPCSSNQANSMVQAGTFYTAETDGLLKDWFADNCFLNPPYRQPLCARFCEKLVASYRAEQLAKAHDEKNEVEHEEPVGVAEAIVLVNNATETAWFQGVLKVASAICLLDGRVSFLDEKLEPKNQPLQGQVVLYLGDQQEAFVQAFEPFGVVLIPQPPREV